MTKIFLHTYGSTNLNPLDYAKSFIAHHLNPLHVYCRLNSIMSRKLARSISQAYETYIYSLIKGV